MSVFEHIERFIAGTLDTVRDIAVTASIPVAVEKFNDLKAQSKRRLFANMCFDCASIIILIAASILNAPHYIDVLIIILINCEIWGVRLFRLYVFNRDVYSRHKDIIKCAVKGAIDSLKRKLHIGLAVKNSVREVCYHYCKVPMLLSTKADIWLRETAEQFIQALYKPIMDYIRYVIVYNFILFVLCYGSAIFLIRRFLINGLV